MSAIAKTASITLITGVPGNGKSLRAVWYIREAVKAGEEVFVCNLNGISIDGITTFDDPTRWEELPAGAILVVDEAQRFFRAAAGAVPTYIQAMETIRHLGIRLILITQSPTLIHANIRQLVGMHEHLVRENGKQAATVYRRSRVIDNVRSERALAAEDHETWVFPSDCFGLYKSAEVHTVKRTISSKMKRGMVMASIAALILAWVWWNGRKLVGKDDQGEPSAVAAPAATADGAAGRDSGQPKWASTTEYAQAHLPRLSMMPWSAQVFDDRPTTADPQLYCMSASPGDDAQGVHQDFSCTCLTEQGTVYQLTHAECRTLARRGPVYNPYKERAGASGEGSGVQGPAPAAMDAQASAVPMAPVIRGDIRAVGTKGEAAQPGTAP